MNFKTKLKKATSIWDKLCHQSLTLLGAMILVGISGFALSATAKEANSKDAPRFRLVEPTSGYVYFNRPKADLAALQEELKFCITETHFVLPSEHQVLDTGLVGGIATSLWFDGPAKAVAAASIESCMVVRGWRVVRIPENEGRELSSLIQTDLIARISPWIGAEEPHGEIVRKWSNDAIHASSHDQFGYRPKFSIAGQLSWQLLSIEAFQSSHVVTSPKPAPKLDAKWPLKKPIGTLKTSEISKAPAGSAFVIFRIMNATMDTVSGVAFSRVGVDLYDHPSQRDHAPEVFGMADFKERWVIVPVQPGRWRWSGMATSNFCLGSPGFDIKAGEVIYAGTFDLASEEMRPNLDLAPAMEYIKDTALVDKIKPATYINGLRGECLAGGINYALEIEGAPFEPNYTWGSAAK